MLIKRHLAFLVTQVWVVAYSLMLAQINKPPRIPFDFRGYSWQK